MQPQRTLARVLGQTVLLLVFTSVLTAAPGAVAGPVEGTPTAGVSVETLLETTFETVAPRGTPALLLFAQVTIPPGGRLTYPPDFVAPSTYFAYVREGSYAVSADWPMLVVRAASDGAPTAPESVRPQTEVLLNAGDAFIYPSVPEGAGLGELQNPGPAPLVTIVGAVYPSYPASFATGADVTVLGSLPGGDWISLVPGQVALSLRQITLSPGTELPPCSLAPTELLAIESGVLEFAFVTEGPVAATPGPPVELRPGGSIAGLRAGTGIAIRNPGDESVLLLDLALTSVGQEAGTPAASTPAPHDAFEPCAQSEPDQGASA